MQGRRDLEKGLNQMATDEVPRVSWHRAILTVWSQPSFLLCSFGCRDLAAPGASTTFPNPKVQGSGRGVSRGPKPSLWNCPTGRSCSRTGPSLFQNLPAPGSHVTGAGRGHAGYFDFLAVVESWASVLSCGEFYLPQGLAILQCGLLLAAFLLLVF